MIILYRKFKFGGGVVYTVDTLLIVSFVFKSETSAVPNVRIES